MSLFLEFSSCSLYWCSPSAFHHLMTRISVAIKALRMEDDDGIYRPAESQKQSRSELVACRKLHALTGWVAVKEAISGTENSPKLNRCPTINEGDYDDDGNGTESPATRSFPRYGSAPIQLSLPQEREEKLKIGENLLAYKNNFLKERTELFKMMDSPTTDEEFNKALVELRDKVVAHWTWLYEQHLR
uniref:Uncharacterized protein n=1 Tax=Globodera rostochiensis TaxID=31243 RepID=A0A914H112_GLORO